MRTIIRIISACLRPRPEQVSDRAVKDNIKPVATKPVAH